MISDVLFEAVREIRWYMVGMPDVYGDADMTAKLDKLVIDMEAIQRELDTPPGPDVRRKMLAGLKLTRDS